MDINAIFICIFFKFLLLFCLNYGIIILRYRMRERWQLLCQRKSPIIWYGSTRFQKSKSAQASRVSTVRRFVFLAETPATTKDGEVIEGKFNVALAERAKVLFKSEEDAKAVAETFGDKCSYDEKNPRAFVVDSAALKERVNTERINYAKAHAGAERRVPETPTAGEMEQQAEEQAEV